MTSNANIATDLVANQWTAGLENAKTHLTLVEGGKSITDSQTKTDEPTTMATGTVAAILPSLEDLPTVAPVKETMQQTQEEIAKKKEWLKQAAPLLRNYEETLLQLTAEAKSSVDDIDLATKLQAQIAAAQDGIKRITSVDPEMMDRLQFSKFIDLVKTCDHLDRKRVQELLASVVAANRYRIADEEEVSRMQATRSIPKHTIFFFGKTYLPTVFEEPAPGQRALEIELVKLVMKARGGNHTIDDLLAGKEGFYYLYSPQGPQDNCEGHALAKLHNDGGAGEEALYRINILDAMGNIGAMADHRKGRTSIPLFWVRAGKVISRKRLEQPDFERALYLIKKLRFILRLSTTTKRN